MAGTRMWRRGADKDGNVANFVETEQVLEAEGFVASYVQVHFSPAYLKWAKWSQACSSIFLRYCLPISVDASGLPQFQIYLVKLFLLSTSVMLQKVVFLLPLVC
jgi:hypothetical protein